jgi:Uma2 family endonuclease
MTTKTRMTLDEFLALPETKPYLEFVRGEVVPKPMPSPNHSAMVRTLMVEIELYLRTNRIARVDTEMRHLARDDERVYLPDVCVTLEARMPIDRDVLRRGPVEATPDLAIEVLSPGDRPGRVADRVDFYLRAGARLVWIVDPDERNVTVYHPGQAPIVARPGDVLDGAPVLPGFTLGVSVLFSILPEPQP